MVVVITTTRCVSGYKTVQSKKDKRTGETTYTSHIVTVELNIKRLIIITVRRKVHKEPVNL